MITVKQIKKLSEALLTGEPPNEKKKKKKMISEEICLHCSENCSERCTLKDAG